MERVRREGEGELARAKTSAEEREKSLHDQLKEMAERADVKEKRYSTPTNYTSQSNLGCRVGELTLINEHLQELLGESQSTSDRLSEDVHRLSLSLSEAQSRLREREREHKDCLSVSLIQ